MMKGLMKMIETANMIEYRVPDSTCIRAYRYDKKSKTLSVMFTSGSIYDYYEIDEEIVREWMTATSVGKYFNQVIRKLG